MTRPWPFLNVPVPLKLQKLQCRILFSSGLLLFGTPTESLLGSCPVSPGPTHQVPGSPFLSAFRQPVSRHITRGALGIGVPTEITHLPGLMSAPCLSGYHLLAGSASLGTHGLRACVGGLRGGLVEEEAPL